MAGSFRPPGPRPDAGPSFRLARTAIGRRGFPDLPGLSGPGRGRHRRLGLDRRGLPPGPGQPGPRNPRRRHRLQPRPEPVHAAATRRLRQARPGRLYGAGKRHGRDHLGRTAAGGHAGRRRRLPAGRQGATDRRPGPANGPAGGKRRRRRGRRTDPSGPPEPEAGRSVHRRVDNPDRPGRAARRAGPAGSRLRPGAARRHHGLQRRAGGPAANRRPVRRGGPHRPARRRRSQSRHRPGPQGFPERPAGGPRPLGGRRRRGPPDRPAGIFSRLHRPGLPGRRRARGRRRRLGLSGGAQAVDRHAQGPGGGGRADPQSLSDPDRGAGPARGRHRPGHRRGDAPDHRRPGP